MKNAVIFTILIIFLTTACNIFEKESFPDPPDEYTVFAETVNLEFKLNRMDGVNLELSLKDADDSDNFYCLFSLSDDWVKGHFGLLLKEMSDSSILEENTGITLDISRFEKDNSGNKISAYPFEHKLVKDDEEVVYISLSYTGPAMPLIESLQVEKNMNLPDNISERFGVEQTIEFQEGKFGLDPEINGFWIPVLLK